jgi:hypothetical protein
MKPRRQQVGGEDEDQGYQGYDHQRCVLFMGLASFCLRTSSTSSFPEMIASVSIGTDRASIDCCRDVGPAAQFVWSPGFSVTLRGSVKGPIRTSPSFLIMTFHGTRLPSVPFGFNQLPAGAVLSRR